MTAKIFVNGKEVWHLREKHYSYIHIEYTTAQDAIIETLHALKIGFNTEYNSTGEDAYGDQLIRCDITTD